MSAIIVRFQFTDFKANELVDLLKNRYGGALSYIAEGTILIDTFDKADDLFQELAPLFTFDDKLFVGELKEFKSMHKVSRSKPSIHKLAM